MIRTLRSRLAALAAAALFLSSGAGELLGAHACPHHDAIAAHGAADSGPADAHADHRTPGAPHDDGAGCSCPGTCSVAGGAALPRAPEQFRPRPPLPAPAAAPVGAARLPARLLPYLLPYAQAPPRAA